MTAGPGTSEAAVVVSRRMSQTPVQAAKPAREQPRATAKRIRKLEEEFHGLKL